MPESNLLGVSEAADRLKVDARTVQRWAADGTLTPVVKLPGANGAYIFDLAVVEAFAATRSAA